MTRRQLVEALQAAANALHEIDIEHLSTDDQNRVVEALAAAINVGWVRQVYNEQEGVSS